MFNKAKKKGLKREDFLFQSGWFDTLVRKPGQLHMQQFQISDCQQSNIYLFDSSACVYIDDCKFCYVFVGPCQSSIFIRNCHYMTIICMTQQFRVRDSTHCKINLWCESQPIIQSSYGLQIDCFNGRGYRELYEQMKQAKLNLWNNNWFDIYDFTPNKFNLESNHAIQRLQENIKYQTKLSELGMKPLKNMIPYSTGNLQSLPFYVLVFHPVPEKWNKNLPIIHSRSMIYPPTLQQQSKLSQKMCLFVKIRKESLHEWEQQSEGAMKVIKDESTLAQVQSQVFIPFKDEH